MNNYCPICGKEINSTSCDPYLQRVIDSEGRLVSGVCIHGVSFGIDYADKEEARKEYYPFLE